MALPIPLALAALALTGAGPAQSAPTAQLASSLARLDPEHFAARVTTRQDSAGLRLTLSTRNSGTREGPSRDVFVDDAHARAVVDRQGGRTAFQIWHEFSFDGNLGDLAAVHYTIGPHSHRALPLGVEQWRNSCGSDNAGPGCHLSTRVHFELPAEHARAIAAAHRPQSGEPWLVRFEDKAGRTVTIGFAPAELAGLIQAHDAWRAGHQG